MIQPSRHLTVGISALVLAGCAMVSAGPTIPRDAELVSALSGLWCAVDESGESCATTHIEISDLRFTSCPAEAGPNGDGCISGSIKVEGRYVCPDAAGREARCAGEVRLQLADDAAGPGPG